jgi:hypothetical protein
MLEVLRPLVPLSAALGIPLIAKPNAGLPHERGDGTQYFDLSAHEFGKYVPSFIESGIYILGGCCGTDDSHISEIKRRIPDFIDADISPANLTGLACTNKLTAVYEGGHKKTAVTDHIAEDVSDSDDDVPLLEVTCTDDAEKLLAGAYMFDRPFALCGDAESVALVLRRYNGCPYVI